MSEQLSNARIDQLPQNAGLKPNFFGVVRNMDDSITERFLMSEILTSTTSGNFEWLSDTPYLEDDAVTWKGEWWQALQDVDENIVPGTNSLYWQQISKSASGFVFWTPGVFPQDDVFVLKDVSVAHDNSDIRMYWLADPTRPFVSSNFTTELAANKWKQLFVSSIVPTSAPQPFDLSASNRSTPIVTGTNVMSFAAAYGMVVTSVRGFLNVPQTSGGTKFTVDIKINGTSIFTTLLTFDNTEKLTDTASVPFVLDGSHKTIVSGDIVSIDVTAIGDGTASGLQITIYGS